MVYTFGLLKHANIRYHDSFIRLSRFELSSMLRALSVDCELIHESLGGADFLTFECRTLSARELSWLSAHSSVFFIAEKRNGMLSPLSSAPVRYLGEDLPEILKYKGKTSVPFLRLMINVSLSLTPFVFSGVPLTVFDPLCGKGTACFCALQAGMNAVGLDIDRKAVREAGDYFLRYLKMNLLKHSVHSFSETSGKASLQLKEIVFADSREHYQKNLTRFFRLASGDTSYASALCRRRPVHILIADMPYGIQHAPLSGNRPESFQSLLIRSLPVWKNCLIPGGAAAISFNTLTLPKQQVVDIVRSSGLTPCENEYSGFLRHEVEHAVIRDVVFMINKPCEGGS